jgi:hypothetical protein
MDDDPIELAFESMKSKFGICPSETDDYLQKLKDCKPNERSRIINDLAAAYKLECDFYLKHIGSMTTNEIEAFVWFIVMKLDLVRGLLPGAQAAPIPELNAILELYENEMWKKIDPYLFSENKPK